MGLEFKEIVPNRVAYASGFLSPADSARLADAIRETSPWSQEKLRIGDTSVPFPRLVAWHGDPGIPYHYSGISHPPADWTAPLSEVRQKIADLLEIRPNGVLLNRYRDGRDSIGRHADREEDLVPGAPIACVSLGTARVIRFRPMAERLPDGSRRRVTADSEVRVTLEDGSLLLMYGDCQRSWTHEIRKEFDANGSPITGERISLTFRTVRT